MKKRGISEVVKKQGTLHQRLEILNNKKIPLNLSNKIISAKFRDVITNHTKTGKEKIKVIPLLERRAILARNLKIEK